MKVDKWPLSCGKLYLSAKRFLHKGVRVESAQEMIENHHQRQVSANFLVLEQDLEIH